MHFFRFDRLTFGRSHVQRLAGRIGIAAVTCAAASASCAMEAASEQAVALRANAPSDAPQVTRIEMDRSASLAAPALANAPPGSRADVSGVSYRFWKRVGPSAAGLDVGVGVGTVGYLVRPPAQSAVDSPANLVNPSTLLTVGMRYRTSERSTVFADTSSARGFAGNGHDAYVAKVGMEWKSASSPVRFMQGGLGLQLDGGGRMTLRVRKGTVGVYMRSSF
ncbi:hypothetical protein BH11PSE9_BH11PSE9_19270 [soil metagenome]